MGEPARKLQPDHEPEPDRRPDLGVIEGGGEGDGKPTGNLRPVQDQSNTTYDPETSGSGTSIRTNFKPGIKIPGTGSTISPKALKDKEAERQAGSSSSASDDEAKKLSPKIGWKFRDESKNKRKLRVRFTRRRTAVAGVGATVLVGGVVGFGVLQGPAQAIHLSQVLGIPSKNNSKTMTARVNGFYRYYKTGNIGETRLGYMGSKMNQKFLGKMSAAGITPTVDPSSGAAKKFTIDPRQNPELKNLSPEEAKAKLGKDFDADRIKVLGNGTVEVDLDGASVRQKNIFMNRLFRYSGGNTTYAAVGARVVGKYFNIPRLFDPVGRWRAALNERGAQILAKKADAKEADARKKVLEERRKFQQQIFKETFEPKGEAASRIKKLKNNLKNPGKVITQNPKLAAGVGLTATGALCLAKESADNIALMNRAAVVDPATLAAITSLGYGATTQAAGLSVFVGKDSPITMEELGDFVSTFYNEETGENIFQSAGYGALTTGRAVGKDIDESTKAAFSPSTNSLKIGKILDDYGAKYACSRAGQAAQFAVGAVLIATSGGVGNIAFQIAGGAVGAVALTQILGMVQSYIADEPIHDLLMTGTVDDGNLRALGADQFAAKVARSGGGVALSSEESQTIRTASIDEDMQEFKNKSYFAQIFDPFEHRSLVASAIRSPSTNLMTNTGSNIIKVLNPATWVSSFANFASSRTFAAERPYDWKSPVYGFSEKIQNDPLFQNPYQNGSVVAGILNGPKSSSFQDRAKACFGAEFTNGIHGWAVESTEDANPAEKSYIEANCRDETDLDWVRLRFFLQDNQAMDAFACPEGSDVENPDPDIAQSCTVFGLDYGAYEQSIEENLNQDETWLTNLQQSISREEAQKIANEILDSGGFAISSKYRSQIQNIANGDFSCNINPDILQLINEVLKSYTINVTSLNRMCTNTLTASGTGSYHYREGGGHAVDIGTVNGIASTGATKEDLDLLNSILPILPSGSGIGQSNCRSGSSLSLPQGVTEFSDSCNHIHIQVPPKRIDQ